MDGVQSPVRPPRTGPGHSAVASRRWRAACRKSCRIHNEFYVGRMLKGHFPLVIHPSIHPRIIYVAICKRFIKHGQKSLSSSVHEYCSVLYINYKTATTKCCLIFLLHIFVYTYICIRTIYKRFTYNYPSCAFMRLYKFNIHNVYISGKYLAYYIYTYIYRYSTLLFPPCIVEKWDVTRNVR